MHRPPLAGGRRAALALLLGLLAMPAAAQVTLDASYFEQFVGRDVQSSVHYVNQQSYAAVASIAEASGTGQTYDFSALSYDAPTPLNYRVLSSTDGTPGADEAALADANWVQTAMVGGTSHIYYRLDDDGFFLLGTTFRQATDVDGNGVLDVTVSVNDPPDPTYRFPVVAGSAWAQAFVSTTRAFDATAVTNTTVDFEVDGSGTLITPVGSAPALRLRKVLTLESAPAPAYSTTSYIFITEEDFSASIVLDAQGNVLGATYAVVGGAATDAEAEAVPAALAPRLDAVYPNPAVASARVGYALARPAHVTLRVVDLLGREVARPVDGPRAAGPHAADVRTDGLAAGVYLVRLDAGGATAVQPFVVRR